MRGFGDPRPPLQLGFAQRWPALGTMLPDQCCWGWRGAGTAARTQLWPSSCVGDTQWAMFAPWATFAPWAF